MKAIIIDSHKKVVYEEEFVKEGALKFMQNAVEGYIETAHEDAQGNTVYVNEEGLLHGEQDFFDPIHRQGIQTGGNDDPVAGHQAVDVQHI